MPVSSVAFPLHPPAVVSGRLPIARVPRPQGVINLPSTSSTVLRDQAAGKPGPGRGPIELSLLGVPKETLQKLEQMLSGRALTNSELATLIAGDFGRTPMGKAMTSPLVDDALRILLPNASGREREDWQTVAVGALGHDLESWHELHKDLSPGLVYPAASKTLQWLHKLLGETAPRDRMWKDVFPTKPTVSARVKALERVSRDATLDMSSPPRNGSGNPWIAALVGILGVGGLPVAQGAEGFDGENNPWSPLLPRSLVDIVSPMVGHFTPVASLAMKYPRAASAVLAGTVMAATGTALYGFSGCSQDNEPSTSQAPLAVLAGRVPPDILANVVKEVRHGDPSLNADERALRAVQALGRAAEEAREQWEIERHGRSDRLPFMEPNLDIEFGGWLIRQVFGEPVPSGGFDMTWSDWKLPNGLRVILVPGKGDVVSVHLRFGYGSGIEREGQRGVAHLAEHLWFSRNLPGKPHFDHLYQAAGIEHNAYTSQDTTDYFAEGEADSLELILLANSHRLAHATDPLPPGALKAELGVVLNELKQRDTAFGRARAVLSRAMYPSGHPYHSPVGGRPADLLALQASDVENFMKARQRPNLGTLVISGSNLDEDDVRTLVTKYFADIEPGNEFPPRAPDVQRRTLDTNEEIFDNVQSPKLYRAWNVPEDGHAHLSALTLAARVLNQRLARALESDVVFAVAYVDPRELGSQFKVSLDMRGDADQERVEETLNDVIGAFVAGGPTNDELDSARRALISSMARKQASSDEIASAVVHCVDRNGDPDCLNEDVQAWHEATPDSVKHVAGDWLSVGSHTLLVSPGDRPRPPSQQPGPILNAPWNPGVPNPELRATPTGVDRTVLPPAPPPAPVNFPAVSRRELPNGLPLVFAPMPSDEGARVVFLFDGGRMGDGDPDTGMGVANLALRVVTRRAGALALDALQERLDKLGLAISGQAMESYSAIFLLGPPANLTEGVGIVKDMLADPRFPADLIDQGRARALANIGRGTTNLDYRSNVLMERLVFGDEHPYGRDPLGEGTEASLGAVTADTMKTWVDRYLDPSNATVVAVGSFDVDALSRDLAQAFGSVDGARQRSRPAVPALTQSAHPGVHVLPVEEGQQSQIVLGYPVRGHPGREDILQKCINRIIQHRVKDTLRREQGMTYGLRPLASETRGVRMHGFTSAVQNDRALDALATARAVVSDLLEGRKPVTRDELNLQAQGYRRKLAKRLQDPWEVQSTLVAAVDGAVADLDVEEEARALGSLTPIEVNAAIGRMSMAHLTWMLAGPAAGGQGLPATSDSDWATSESEEGQNAGTELRLRLTAMGLQHFTMVDPQTGARTVHWL